MNETKEQLEERMVKMEFVFIQNIHIADRSLNAGLTGIEFFCGKNLVIPTRSQLEYELKKKYGEKNFSLEKPYISDGKELDCKSYTVLYLKMGII